MTPEERDIISRFIARVGGAPAGGFGGGGQPPALPPIDPEADQFIGEQFASHPEARYRITQLAFVQEAALTEAQNRMRQMQAELQQARAQQPPQGQSRGFFGGLFGGGQTQAPPQQSYAPPPPYAPPPQGYPGGYQPGMLQRGGSGFLGSALTTAAGVAGGVLAADAITSMFRGGGGFGGGYGGGFGGPGEVNETVVNNYGDAANADPWAGAGQTDPGAGSDPWGGAGQADPGSDPFGGAGQTDPGDMGGGWDDQGGGGGDGGGDGGIF